MLDRFIQYCGTNLAGIGAATMICLQLIVVYIVTKDPYLIIFFLITSVVLAMICYIGSLHQEHELEKIRAMREEEFED